MRLYHGMDYRVEGGSLRQRMPSSFSSWGSFLNPRGSAERIGQEFLYRTSDMAFVVPCNGRGILTNRYIGKAQRTGTKGKIAIGNPLVDKGLELYPKLST